MVVAVVVIAGAANYLRPLPASKVTLHLSTPAAVTPDVLWPASGQAAIAASDYGLLNSYGVQSPLATASTAKVITALCVLSKDPLQPGDNGPSFTVNANDVAIFKNYVAEDGSLLPVNQGEQITEYQALEALMVPSANNIADSLVQWVFGSQTAYAAYANTFLLRNNLDSTHIGTDASGYDPSTTSTAGDLAQLGLLALKNPVLMQIAGQRSAVLPVAGKVSNYDTVLGQDGISGLKTGNNTIDKGAFIFTSSTRIGDEVIPLTGAVMGAPNLATALQESVRLAGSFQRGFQQVTVAKAGQAVGYMNTPWGDTEPVAATTDLQLVRWEATPITEKSNINAKQTRGTVGTLKLFAGPSNSRTTLVLTHAITPPSFWWRLSRH